MSENHYTHKLYPLQDKVLAALGDLKSTFYLTGGTTLSRHYLHHRYSDDLDFFFNQDKNFKGETEAAIQLLKNSFEIDVKVVSESYVQLTIDPKDVPLKVEFVNDVGYRFDQPISTNLFVRTDNWRNILSNKITALSREAPKDIADIVFLSQKFNFNWIDIILEARSKDSWVSELQTFKMLDGYAIDKLQNVNWIEIPDFNKIEELLKTIAKDILLGGDNSLAQVQ